MSNPSCVNLLKLTINSVLLTLTRVPWIPHYDYS